MHYVWFDVTSTLVIFYMIYIGKPTGCHRDECLARSLWCAKVHNVAFEPG